MTDSAGPELAQTERSRPDDGRCPLLPAALFLCCALLWNPEALAQPGKTGYLPLFTPNALAFLAAGLVFCAPKFQAMRKFMIAAACGFALLLTGQFIRHYPACWTFAQFGDGLWWIALPALAYVYGPAFRKLLPVYVLAVGGYAFLHSVWADLLGIWTAGITGNENWTAELFVMTMIFLGGVLYDRRQKAEQPRKKLLILIFGIAAELLLLHRIWKIGSKGALLALMLAAAGYFWLRSNPKVRRITLGLGLIGLLAGAVWLSRDTDAISRFMHEDGRVIFWENAVSLIADHPLFGVGQGSYENHYMTYRNTDYFWLKNPAVRSNHPHSHLLFMAGSWGLCGLVLWGVLLFAPLAVTVRKFYRRETVDPLETACFLTLVCAILHGSLDLIMITMPTGAIALLCLGLLARDLADPARPPIAARRKILLIPAGAMILFAAGIAGRNVYAARQVRLAWRNELSPEEIVQTVKYCPDDYPANYQFLLCLEKRKADPRFSVAVTDIMLRSHTPNYPGLNMGRANALMRLGDFRRALIHYQREAELFPLMLRPVYNMIVAAYQLKEPALAAKLDEELRRRMQLRGNSQEDLKIILTSPKGAHYDLRPREKPEP